MLSPSGVSWAWGSFPWLPKRPSLGFWYPLRLPRAVGAVPAVVGFTLVAGGASPPDGLHIAYGIAPLVITLVSEGMRLGAAQRELEGVEDVDALERSEQVAIARRVALGEMGVMTVGTLLIVTLALRAYQTGG